VCWPNNLTAEEIQNELADNAQGILGYVVSWVDSGVGRLKVLDINNVGLICEEMRDKTRPKTRCGYDR